MKGLTLKANTKERGTTVGVVRGLDTKRHGTKIYIKGKESSKRYDSGGRDLQKKKKWRRGKVGGGGEGVWEGYSEGDRHESQLGSVGLKLKKTITTVGGGVNTDFYGKLSQAGGMMEIIKSGHLGLERPFGHWQMWGKRGQGQGDTAQANGGFKRKRRGKRECGGRRQKGASNNHDEPKEHVQSTGEGKLV